MNEIEIQSLADRIAETAAMLDAGTHRLLTDIRRFDTDELWAIQGALSCAHWLNWRCGIALGAAREKVRVARALATPEKRAQAPRARHRLHRVAARKGLPHFRSDGAPRAALRTGALDARLPH